MDTVIIGGGQAGLSSSWHLAARGLEHVVLERGRVGETWRSQRWDGFYLNTPNWTLYLPGFHYSGPHPDAFASLQQVIAYLESYAKSFSCPIRERTEVLRVHRNGGSLLVETGGRSISARNVIVAAGAYQRPTPSPVSAELPPDVMQLHTSEYKRPDQLPPGAVVIVGSGQSGCQVAEELLAAGRVVYLSAGRCPWLPRTYRGRDLTYWLKKMGLADMTLDALPSPGARLACNAPVSGNDGGHDCNPRTLARMGARLLGRVEDVDGGRLRLGRGLKESLSLGDMAVAQFKKDVDRFLGESDALDSPPEETYAVAPGLDELDLGEAGVSTVIWANGFRPDISWIEGIESDRQGWPVHNRGVTAIPGLYFVGLHWLHKRKSALFLGVGEDAEHVVAHLASRVSARPSSSKPTPH